MMYFKGNGLGRNQPSGIIGDVSQHIHESLKAADNIEFKVHLKKCASKQTGSYIIFQFSLRSFICYANYKTYLILKCWNVKLLTFVAKIFINIF